MVMTVGLEINGTGPVFDGRADREMDSFLTAWRHTVAVEGQTDIRFSTWTTFQNPTGAYQSGIMVEDRQTDTVIHDSDSVYGPWLEGVSRRNKTTRFKGYNLFKKQAQALNVRAAQIGQSIIQPFLQRMQ